MNNGWRRDKALGAWWDRCATCGQPTKGHPMCGGRLYWVEQRGCGILAGRGHSGGPLVGGLCGSCRAARRTARVPTIVVLGGSE